MDLQRQLDLIQSFRTAIGVASLQAPQVTGILASSDDPEMSNRWGRVNNALCLLVDAMRVLEEPIQDLHNKRARELKNVDHVTF
jgi:hypothetical protein